MNRLLLPFLAFFLLPAAAVGMAESVLHLPALESVVSTLPPAVWISDIAESFGAAPSSPVPLLAAGFGVAVFFLSSALYAQVTSLGGDEMMQTRLYARISARLFSLIFLAAGGTFAICFFYMKLSRQLSIFLALLAMAGAYRLVINAHWPRGQGQGRTTAEDAEAQRGTI